MTGSMTRTRIADEGYPAMNAGRLLGRRRVLQALGAAAVAGGCSFLSPQTLDEPPRWLQGGRRRPPAVFIHGAFGSRLRNRLSGREIWPIGLADLVVSSFDELELPLDPDTGAALPDAIVASGLFDETGVVDFYGSMVHMLEAAGGYRVWAAGTDPPEDAIPLYPFLYDWRRGFADTAPELDRMVEQIRADHGDPGLKVDLVAHSSGGLIARYFLLYGGRLLPEGATPVPDFGGAGKVSRALAIGVPEIGMARAVAALTVGEPIVMNKVGPEVLATSLSTFDLLPHGDDVWLIDRRGTPIVADACDPEIWRTYEMGIFNRGVRAQVRERAGGGRSGQRRLELLERGFLLRLDRAGRFRRALRAAPIPADIAYLTIGGDCKPTEARLLAEEFMGRPEVKSLPDRVRNPRRGVDYRRLMLEPGDGRVARPSVLATPAWPASPRPVPLLAENWARREFVCASHNQLTVNTDCQRAMLHALADLTA
jgi:pimeloyl-ACP methyl ester carboxylesterase